MTTSQTDLAIASYGSPFGTLTLAASPEGLRAVLWPRDRRGTEIGVAGLQADGNGILAETGRQLDEYFAGVRTSFELKLDLRGTAFQLDAWRALAEIPYGETRTYAQQAERIGRVGAYRAVGAANGRNPLSVVLPCHRVVGSDGSLTGFAAGLETKAGLLDHERSVASQEPGHPRYAA